MGKKGGSALGNLVSSVPIVGGIFDDSQDRALNESRDSRRMYERIGLPSTQWEDFNPLAYTNEDAQYQTISEDPALRLKQLNMLSRFEDLSNDGLTAEDELAFLRARQMGDQQAKSGTQSAIADAQVRGVAGSGQEFALREAAQQAGAQRAQEAAMQQAAAAASNRNQYLQAYASQLGQTRQQDFGANQANSNIINQFNQANTQARNQAQRANTDMRNNATQYNQQGRRDMGQQNFDNQITRAGGIAQARRETAKGYAAQNAARTADRNANTDLAFKALEKKGVF